MEEYRQFLAQPRSVKQLNAELEAKVQLLTDFKTNLSETQVELEGMVGVFTAFFLEAWKAPVYRKGEIVE
ncbi:hypothetical protein SEF58_08965 [Neomoorella humiferrea]|uniref:Uncharacterized protein n=1 Tax=Neomoorella humiferrea TaxID=676965 RepID=A0A2T0ANX0_9FIRM|nr:hypothetical protein MOHU_18260 [Moorella humiferrea]